MQTSSAEVREGRDHASTAIGREDREGEWVWMVALEPAFGTKEAGTCASHRILRVLFLFFFFFLACLVLLLRSASHTLPA